MQIWVAVGFWWQQQRTLSTGETILVLLKGRYWRLFCFLCLITIFWWQFSHPANDHVDIPPDTMHQIKTHINISRSCATYTYIDGYYIFIYYGLVAPNVSRIQHRNQRSYFSVIVLFAWKTLKVSNCWWIFQPELPSCLMARLIWTIQRRKLLDRE